MTHDTHRQQWSGNFNLWMIWIHPVTRAMIHVHVSSSSSVTRSWIPCLLSNCKHNGPGLRSEVSRLFSEDTIQQMMYQLPHVSLLHYTSIVNCGHVITSSDGEYLVLNILPPLQHFHTCPVFSVRMRLLDHLCLTTTGHLAQAQLLVTTWDRFLIGNIQPP